MICSSAGNMDLIGSELEKSHPSVRKHGLFVSTVDMAMDSSAKVKSHNEAANVKGDCAGESAELQLGRSSCYLLAWATGDKFFHCSKKNEWVRRFTFHFPPQKWAGSQPDKYIKENCFPTTEELWIYFLHLTQG